jgi:hypothetical protein
VAVFLFFGRDRYLVNSDLRWRQTHPCNLHSVPGLTTFAILSSTSITKDSFQASICEIVHWPLSKYGCYQHSMSMV